MQSVQKELGIVETDHLLALTTIGFDIAGLEIFGPLIQGAKVVLLDSDSTKIPAKINQAIEKYQIAYVQATPSLWELILEEKIDRKIKVLIGGEALPKRLAKKLRQIGDVLNLYGH